MKPLLLRVKNEVPLASNKLVMQACFHDGFSCDPSLFFLSHIYNVHTIEFHCHRQRAFSLVEVVLSLSIISFAALTLLGLMANGLQSVHQAISTTVQAQIMQSIVNNAEIQSYNNGSFTNSAGSAPAVFYFDDQGTPVYGTPAPTNYLYLATVTSTNLTLPGTAGAASSTPIAQVTRNSEPGVGAMLQVVIASHNNINQTVTNTLVWPNTTGQGY